MTLASKKTGSLYFNYCMLQISGYKYLAVVLPKGIYEHHLRFVVHPGRFPSKRTLF